MGQLDKGNLFFIGLFIYVTFGSTFICYGANASRQDQKLFNNFTLIVQAVSATLCWQTLLLAVRDFKRLTL